MIRLAFFIDTIACDTAGTEKQLLETIRRIDSSKFECHLVLLKTSEWIKKNSLPCTYYIAGYRGFTKINILKVIINIGRYLRKNKIDIVHTFFDESIFMAYFSKVASLRKNIELVSSRRDIGLGAENRPWYYHLYNFILPMVNLNYAKVICNSEEVKRTISKKEKIVGSKLRVIRNGINLNEKYSKRPSIYNGNRDTVWIGIVASLTPVKRHEDLLYSMHILKSRGVEGFKLVILGDGPLKDKLIDISFKLGIEKYVCFEGAVSNVHDYLMNTDVGVLCSEREGLSNAILEYMACSLPVVATETGGNKELVGKENGCLVPVRRPEALADALEVLIIQTTKRKSLGKKSFNIIRNNYSWDITINQLQCLYNDLFERKYNVRKT